MRDNKSDINQEYVNSSWLEMKEVLDVHLPQKRKKRVLWWFFPLGLICLIMVLNLFPISDGDVGNIIEEPIEKADLIKREQSAMKNNPKIATSVSEKEDDKKNQIVPSKVKEYYSKEITKLESKNKKMRSNSYSNSSLTNKSIYLDSMLKNPVDKSIIKQPKQIFNFPFINSIDKKSLIVSSQNLTRDRDVTPLHHVQKHNSGLLVYGNTRVYTPTNLNGEIGFGYKIYMTNHLWLLPGFGIGYDNYTYNSKEKTIELLSFLQNSSSSTNLQNFESGNFTSLSLQLGFDYKALFSGVSIYKRYLNSPIFSINENDSFAENISADFMGSPGTNQVTRDVNINKSTSNPLFLGFKLGYYINSDLSLTFDYYYQVNYSEELRLNYSDDSNDVYSLNGKRNEIRIGLQYQF